MALNFDLEPGDILVVPPNSGAHIRVAEKSGRRTRVAVESAKPIKVLRARDAHSGPNEIERPRPSANLPTGRPRP